MLHTHTQARTSTHPPALSLSTAVCPNPATPLSPTARFRILVYTSRSGFALMQLCCRATALRASFLQQQPAAAVAVHAATVTRGGFLGPTTERPSGRGLRTRASATAGISMFSGRSTGAPAGRPAHTTTRALVAAALLLSSSSSSTTVVAGGATRLGGWGGRRKGAHSPPSMAASTVASDATAGDTSAAVEEGALPAAKLPVVFVLGGPGSGKGTQCERLAKDYG